MGCPYEGQRTLLHPQGIKGIKNTGHRSHECPGFRKLHPGYFLKYFFQARWTADTTRASNATYTAVGTDGTTSQSFDQKINNNAWVNIGLKVNSTANAVATVKLGTSSLGTVAADAVRAAPVTAVTTSVNYIFADHLDTPRVITRSVDNQMVWRWDTAAPFGAAQPNANPAGLGVFTYNPRFPGQVYDSETGLYYNYHRHYSPQTGTYTQSDPIGLSGGINTYAYVNGNPVNLVDPLGLSDYAPGIGGVFSKFWDWYDKKNPPITDPPPPRKSDCPDKDCKKIKQKCVNQCFPIFDKGDGNGYLKCIAECLIENGCSSYNPKWKT